MSGEQNGGGAGGGEEEPSRLREEKLGISGLPTDMTRRRPEVWVGDRRCLRGRDGGPGGGREGGCEGSIAAEAS